MESPTESEAHAANHMGTAQWYRVYNVYGFIACILHV
jgi:hypothetical protein